MSFVHTAPYPAPQADDAQDASDLAAAAIRLELEGDERHARIAWRLAAQYATLADEAARAALGVTAQGRARTCATGT